MSNFLATVTGISYSSPSTKVYARAVPVTFVPTFSAGPLSSTSLQYQEIWQFGDGTYSYDSIPTHIFSEQGVYPVTYTVILPNSATGELNDEVKTVTMMLSVYNYLTDSVVWLSGAPGTYQSVQQEVPFVIGLSSSNVDGVPYVQLYARGSRSQPWQDPQTKWSHLKPQWRFTDISGKVISSATPDTYTPITIDLSGNRTFDGTGTVVGLSATVQFYYIDDLPSQNLDNSVTPVTLVATLITSAYMVDVNTVRYVPSYMNSTVKAESDHNIKFLEPTHLKITTNGITPLTPLIWKNQVTPYTVTVHPAAPYDDVILKNFPLTSFLLNSFSTSLSNVDSGSVSFSAGTGFERYDDAGFDTGGYFRGTMVPATTASKTNIVVDGSVVYGSLVEPFGAWVSNPYFNQVTFITTQDTQTGTQFVSSSYTVPNSQIYGIARVTGDVSDASWLTDPINDRIYRISRSFGLDRTFDLDSYPELSATVINNDFGLTPTGVVLNSNRDLWVTLFDGVSTLKLDQNNGNILAVAVPTDSAVFIDSPGLSGVGGDFTVRPTKVEVDKNDNIWVAYNHPLSSFLCKFDTNGSIITTVYLPLYSKPYDMVSDSSNNIWVTLSYAISGLSGQVVKFDENGTYINGVSGYRVPAYITLDQQQNAWFVHDYNMVTRVDVNNFSAQTFTLVSTTLTADPPAPIELNVLYDQELGGISCDWFNRVWVLNSYDNRVYMIDANSPGSIAGELQITPVQSTFVYSLQGYGDWHGLQWYNKFGAVPLASIGSTITLNLSGTSDVFTIQDFKTSYDIRKVNENFDGVEKIRGITLQENIRRNDVLFEKLIKPIAGSIDGDPLILGTAVYEKIANFVANQGDIDTCNIPSLYSLHQEIDIPIDQYDLSYPADVKRLMDMLSVSLTRLKPTRSKFSKDFKKYNVASSGANRGALIDTLTYMASAGTNIIVNLKYSTYYEKIELGTVGLEILQVPQLSGWYSQFPVSAFPLSSYPLSTYNGWGLDTPVNNYYTFYEYVSGFDDSQVEGVIDWDNAYTTLSESISSVDDWYKDGGLVDLIFNYYILKGLGLIKD